MAHLLFLSHAGADTEGALRLAAAIEASPEAQAAGFEALSRHAQGDDPLKRLIPQREQ